MLPLLGEWHGEGVRAPPPVTTGSASGSGSATTAAASSPTSRGPGELTDDGAIIGPDDRESGFWRPRGQDDVELLVTNPDGLVEIYVGTARTTTSWELSTDVLARTPDAPDVTPRRPALRHRRRRADVRHRPRRPGRTAAATDVRPTRTDPMTTALRHPRARSPTRYVDAVCDLDPIVAHLAGHPTRRRPAARPQPGRARGGGGADPRDAGRARPGARRGPGAGRRPGRAELRPVAARAAGRRARRARGGGGAAGRCRTCSVPVHSIRQVFSLMPTAHRGGLGRHRPPDGAGAGGLRRLPGEPRGGRPPRAARRPAPGAHRRRPARRVAGRPVLRRLRRRPVRRRCAPTSTQAARGRRRGRRRHPGLPARRATRPLTEGTPDAVGRERYAARRAPLERLRPGRRTGPGGGLRLGLVGAPPDPGRAARRGREGAARGDPDGGHALAGHERPGRRGRGGDPRPAADDDGRRDRRAGRHALRPRRARAPGRGDDRAAGQRGRAVLHPARRRTSPGPAAPGCRRWAGPASRCGTSSRSGTTRASPATTCSWRSGPTSRSELSTLPDVAGLGRRQRRGLGAVRRAADGRAGLLQRPGRAARLPGRAAAALGPGGHRHRHAPRAADPGRRGGLAGRAPRASRGRRSWRGRSSARTPAPTSPSSTASWSATSASRARRSATSWGSGPGWRAGRRRGRPAAPTSTSRPGTWPRCHRARSAWTTWPPSWRGCSRGAAIARPVIARPRPCRGRTTAG